MESSLVTIIKIAKVSQELSILITDTSSSGVDGLEISRVLSCLDRIIKSCRAILELLNQSMVTSTAPDEQLEAWVSANGPVICLLALNEMEKLIRTNDVGEVFLSIILPSIFNPPLPHERIRGVIQVFDNHKLHFDCLLMSDLWNYKAYLSREVTATALPVSLHVAIPAIHDFGCHPRLDMTTNRHHRNISRKECEVRVNLGNLEIVLQWLDAFRCIEKHVDILSQRQSNTGKWLLGTTQYKEWAIGKSMFLWLHGKAGSGKSVLIASTIEYLEEMLADEPLAFFYCDFGTEDSTDAVHVIRSLLCQLLDQYRHGNVKPGAPDVVDELVKETYKGDAVLKSTTHLTSLVSRVTRQFRRQPLIVVDALDECKDVDRLLSSLLVLKADGVRLLVSSRPIQLIRHRFSGFLSISMDKMAEAVSADIELHVNREVESHSRLALLDPALKQEVCSILRQKADGMFRWVQCQLNALKACITLRELQETLDDLPLGLEATYEGILLRIDQRKSERNVARHALMWLVTASRPLMLSEMVEALSIDPVKLRLDQGLAPIHKYALLDVLGSLVIHNEESDVVHLSHFSVKEYLMSELTHVKLPSFHINLKKAHKQLFRLCMCYLSASLASFLHVNGATQPLEQDVAIFDSTRQLPLLDYVFSCGFDHLAHLEPTDDTILDPMLVLQAEIQRRPLEWERVCGLASLYHVYKSWITPEHDFIVCVLISLFPEPFLRAFLNRTPCKTKYNSNPLVHTVLLNKVDHARTLLSQGVDVNSSGCEFSNSGQIERTIPLTVALRHENDALFDLFLKEGCAAIPQQLYSAVFQGGHCAYAPRFVLSLLQADEFVEWAAENSHSRVLSLPLDNRRYRQLQLTEEDLVVITRRLVQVGYDLSSEQFLLLVASATSSGHLSFLEYLFFIEAPIPSGILAAETVAPLIHDLALRGIDIKASLAKGDISLRRILGNCFGGSQCWVLTCLCSASRTTLLAAFGQEEEKTLVKIITVAQKLIESGCPTRFTGDLFGNHDILPFAQVVSQLTVVRSASGALLQAIHRSTLSITRLDYQTECWLSGNGPNECLEILREMLNLAEAAGASISVEENLGNVATLFDKERGHFHFLLETAGKSKGGVARRRPANGVLPHLRSRIRSGYPIVAEPPEVVRMHSLKLPPLPASRVVPQFQLGHCLMRMSSSRPLSSVPTPRGKTSFIFVGQPGVGKSTLINMIMGVPVYSQAAARVRHGGRTGTLHNTCYSCTLGAGLKYDLWDTRGLGPSMYCPFTDNVIPQVARGPYQRTVLVWCIQADHMDGPIYWKQLREVQEMYYGRIDHGPAPVVVITMDPGTDGWKAICENQIRRLDLRVGLLDFGDSVVLLRVRRHRGTSSPEYMEDSKALRDHIFHLTRNPSPPLYQKAQEI